MTIAAVLFDWAGTMVDFGSRAPVAAMQRVFTAAGVPVSDAVVRRYMGQAKREHVEAMLAEEDVAARWQQAHGSEWTSADVDRLMDELEPAMAAEAVATAALIPGALDTLAALRARGIRVGSTTGYTRTMMAGIVPRAAEQGYAPEVIVCAGETAAGRPAPLMLWKALVEMGVWPACRAVAIDDANVGIEAGRHAGCWTVGVAASGNGMGLSLADYAALSDDERMARLRGVAEGFAAAGADVVVPSVADLSQALDIIEARIATGLRPGDEECAFLLD
ncbi:phosphonoacetaldehyde hydrolase [Sphingopyxis sp. H115]|uniref:phosphonoacetaldehyde hydrolase n=1 Tax=Sphingopyxis sp. H115 TaxID=1759073 RepID=UPI000737A044|nr:phosphonoacetaldehyde hydrolase [Sphingopyxis sp. H115]KTE14049.1 phosphonoacetaldehyde hydrolase [Sphingopyxis sp. H115]